VRDVFHKRECHRDKEDADDTRQRHAADNNSAEQWEAEGSLDMAQRANAIWKKMLHEYEPPPIDPAVDEALLDYVARRKASFPDSNV